MPNDKISLSHGSGGRLMHQLIREMLLGKLGNPVLNELSDGAYLNASAKIVFTTDSFVVSPLFFPGGDIGKLSVCGTVNDLAVMGAEPKYLSLALIIEEGFSLKLLGKIIDSIAATSRKAGVAVVTGDMKVVERGACDKIFINTSGVGILTGPRLSAQNIKPGDKVIVTGNIAEHGLSVLASRKGLSLGFEVKSDSAALNALLLPLLARSGSAVKFMRDPTRGGLATTLNEISQASGLGVYIDEKSVPVSARVNAACELLGIDPLYVANEGKAVIVASESAAGKILIQLKKHPLGRNSSIIGEVNRRSASRVILKTVLGTERFVDMLSAEALPRIC